MVAALVTAPASGGAERERADSGTCAPRLVRPRRQGDDRYDDVIVEAVGRDQVARLRMGSMAPVS